MPQSPLCGIVLAHDSASHDDGVFNAERGRFRRVFRQDNIHGDGLRPGCWIN